MKVWLLTVGEPLPIDPGQPRLHRGGIIADILAQRGDDVTWWTSTFHHTDKAFRFPETKSVRVNDRLKLWCLQSRPYARNISVARLLANRDIAAEFRRRAGDELPPDVILASYPIPELSRAGAEYAAVRSIPCIVDIRDLWPDAWTTILPKLLQPLGSLALLPFYRQSRVTLRGFSGICAITDDMVDWGLARAGRKRGKWDRAFPLAYPETIYSPVQLVEARRFWSAKLDGLPPARLKLCFFGNISTARARIDVMIDAMRLLPHDVKVGTRLVICGLGEGLDALRKSAADVLQIVFAGWANGPQIQTLASSSHAGILPYPSDEDFKRSIPNKAIEYLAHGLPILTSLKGPVSSLIASEGCGRVYRETDARDLAATLVDLFNAPRQLETMADNARRAFRDRFLATNVYGRLANMLTDIVQTTRR